MSSEQLPHSEGGGQDAGKNASEIENILADVEEHGAERARVIAGIKEYLIRLGCPCVVVYSTKRGVSDDGYQDSESREVVCYVYGDPNLEFSDRFYIFTATGELLVGRAKKSVEQGDIPLSTMRSNIRAIFDAGEMNWEPSASTPTVRHYLKDVLHLLDLPNHLDNPDEDKAEMKSFASQFRQGVEQRRSRQWQAEDAVYAALKEELDGKDDNASSGNGLHKLQ